MAHAAGPGASRAHSSLDTGSIRWRARPKATSTPPILSLRRMAESLRRRLDFERGRELDVLGHGVPDRAVGLAGQPDRALDLVRRDVAGDREPDVDAQQPAGRV